MKKKQEKDLEALKAKVVTDATNLVMEQFVDQLMKEFGVVDPRTENYCERQVFHQLWRALNEAEWAVAERAMV